MIFELRFHPKESHLPVATSCKKFTGITTHLGKQYQFESYRWYYVINNGIGCCFLCPHSPAMGYHDDDIEGVVVLFNDNHQPEHVYFHAHGHGQGTWRIWDDCEKTDAGALVIYVARYSHASYPKAGIYWRGFGFANDIASNKGRRMIYDTFITAPSGIVKKPLPSKSITPFLRFTLPLFMKTIREL